MNFSSHKFHQRKKVHDKINIAKGSEERGEGLLVI